MAPQPSARPAISGEETLLVTETCRGGARFTNRFWVEARSHAVFRFDGSATTRRRCTKLRFPKALRSVVN
jgi:hypothetical protein